MSDVTEEIKARLDIVQILSEYISLRPAGTNFRAICPFHNEKTPSLMVSPEKQIWHCFGCGAGGDIFGFVMRMEGLEFPEALRILAKKAGVMLKRQDPQAVNHRTKLLDICQAAASFFHQALNLPAGKMALEYLKGRGLEDETIEKFQLGYAFDAWDSLLKFLTQKGFSEKDIETAGLIAKRQSGTGYYDRFKNRVMFPIADTHGNIVGFTGRILKEDPNHPSGKYVNSPETPLYNKSAVLYGLDKAKTEIKKKNAVIIVEGQMDAITSHQHGFANTIASSGTAITANHINLLKRYTKNFIFALDSDNAGQLATSLGDDVKIRDVQEKIRTTAKDRYGREKVYDVYASWLSENVNIKVIEIPKGKDPDEYIKNNPKEWQKVIDNAKSIMQHYFDGTFDNLDLSSVDNRRKAANYLLEKIGKIYDGLEQDYWIKKVAEKLNADEKIIREEMVKISKKTYSHPVKAGGAAKTLKNRNHLLSERLLALALKFPDNLPYLVENLDPQILTTPKLRQLADFLIIHYTEKVKAVAGAGRAVPLNGDQAERRLVFNYGEFIKDLERKNKDLKEGADYLFLLAEKEFGEEDSGGIETEIKKNLIEIKDDYYFSEQKEIEREMKTAEKEKRQEDVEALLKQFKQVNQKRLQLKSQD